MLVASFNISRTRLQEKEGTTFGFRGDGSAGPSVIPDLLVFHSWWNEEVAIPSEFQRSGDGMGVRKMLTLHHRPASGDFLLFLAR